MAINQRTFNPRQINPQPVKESPPDLEWWIISKRLIFKLIAVGLLVLMTASGAVYVWLYGNPFKKVGETVGTTTGARFVSFEGDVRVVRARTRETIIAHGDTQLYPGDTVQTQAEGRALISMIDGSTCLVRPNSVVTIRDNTTVDDGSKGTRANVRVAVDRGQVNVRTQNQPTGTNNVVETTQTESYVTENTNASFGVHDDRTSDIRVATGTVKTTTGNGEKLSLTNNEYVAFNQNGSVRNRESLLAAPSPVSPHDLERIPVADGNMAQVTLRWQQPNIGALKNYRVEVASSPFFVDSGKVFERDQLETTQLGVGELRLGNYFWRVRAVTTSGQISEWSDPQKFIIAPNGTKESVKISNVTYDYVAGNIYLVRGTSPAGTHIRLIGRETMAIGNNTFQIQVSIPKGTHFLQLEAEDAQGNRTSYRVIFNPSTSQT
ncbi:MAG: hypothetical protein NVSMB56_10720 [Pyrinomonadaceae bacterium]